MKKKSLSYFDRLWMRFDDPNNLVIITGVILLGGKLNLETFETSLEHTLARFQRLRQRLVKPGFKFRPPYWEKDPNFDLNQHIEKRLLFPTADKDALEQLIGELMSVDLDASRPLWKFYIIEDYGEGSAIICRVHHGLADGIALMHVLHSLASTNAMGQEHDSQSFSQTAKKKQLEDRKFWQGETVWESTRNFLGEVALSGIEILLDPDIAREYIRSGAGYSLSTGKLVVRCPDTKTILKGSIGGEKKATWSDPISLEELKSISHAVDGTINDVLLNLISGALRRYMEYLGENVDSKQITGLIPVNLRPSEFDGELGNKLGLVFLELPVGIFDPISRQYELKRTMDDLKSSKEPVITYGLLNVLGASPDRLQDAVVRFFEKKGSIVITNVPGPKDQLFLGGVPVETIMAWVPQPGHLGVGISIISYFGKVWLGIATDNHLIPDPQSFINNFEDELEEMKYLVEDLIEKGGNPLVEMHSELDKALGTVDKLIESTNVQ